MTPWMLVGKKYTHLAGFLRCCCVPQHPRSAGTCASTPQLHAYVQPQMTPAHAPGAKFSSTRPWNTKVPVGFVTLSTLTVMPKSIEVNEDAKPSNTTGRRMSTDAFKLGGMVTLLVILISSGSGVAIDALRSSVANRVVLLAAMTLQPGCGSFSTPAMSRSPNCWQGPLAIVIDSRSVVPSDQAGMNRKLLLSCTITHISSGQRQQTKIRTSSSWFEDSTAPHGQLHGSLSLSLL